MDIKNLPEYFSMIDCLLDDSRAISIKVFEFHQRYLIKIKNYLNGYIQENLDISKVEKENYKNLLKNIEETIKSLSRKIQNANTKREKSRIAIQKLVNQGIGAGQKIICRECNITRCHKKVEEICEDYVLINCLKLNQDGDFARVSGNNISLEHSAN